MVSDRSQLTDEFYARHIGFYFSFEAAVANVSKVGKTANAGNGAGTNAYHICTCNSSVGT